MRTENVTARAFDIEKCLFVPPIASEVNLGQI